MSNNEALDDKTVQALAERLWWPQNGGPYAYRDNGQWHLTLAGVADCIEGLGLDVHCDGDSLFRCLKFPLTEGPTAPFCSTLTAAVTAAVKEMFK